MTKQIIYVHPNSNRITSETYSITVLGDIAYIVMLCEKAGSLWNSDIARDKLLNEIISRELKLVPHFKIQLIVSLGEFSQQRTLQFKLYLKEEGSTALCTDFEKRILPKQELLDQIADQINLPIEFAN
ncbi:hypothetical protein VIBNISOn1_1480018 [Vibrio nigripulchritudo SOn1]|uniref:Uncharacterized protein n=1 Tax=Vibrio nigripulchritudo SOn1 TaxID=1238450 RepID=A0AAV2VLV1_9VIBR|nr:hypothetical protein [Vibrio nigripulchritudo]CCO45444.1 hypothetical protein VIBNISOn1_1480018 [Vibrio nigripulchritudo SOn1]